MNRDSDEGRSSAVASKRRRVGTWGLSLLLLLGGCGGGGDDGGAAPDDPVPEVIRPGEGRVVALNHDGFVLHYDCDARVTVRFAYVLQADAGQVPRADQFTLDDPRLPPDCPAQRSSASYASVVAGWDRGHLVAANHMDGSEVSMAATFHMTNIVPQRAAFNRGVWQDTETLAECWRDIAPVQVFGGLQFDDAANDFFLASHGVPTPDAFWKLLVSADATGQARAIAWWFENRDDLGALDANLISVAELKRRIGAASVGLPILPAALEAERPAAGWPLPADCEPG